MSYYKNMARRFKAGLLAVGEMRDAVRFGGKTYEEAGELHGYSRQSGNRAVRIFEAKYGLSPTDPNPLKEKGPLPQV
jgi:hypothetical protein